MSAGPLLEVRGLGKRFDLYATPRDRMLEWLSLGWRRRHAEHWAVRGVSFELGRGEALGVLGLNGAGKTTLLRMLAGALEPTEGSSECQGRVASVLALGAGLRPELTGRQNVVVGAQLMGLPEGYAERHLEGIAAFSGLEDFFERRVAFYSRGMRTRLAFALFAFVEADLLIMDEALSGGDATFRERCYERLERLVASGASVIMTTHQARVLEKYCRRVLVLHQGRPACLGEPAESIERYRALYATALGRAPRKPP